MSEAGSGLIWTPLKPVKPTTLTPCEFMISDRFKLDQNLRLVGSRSITPELISEFKLGAPYDDNMTSDERNYAQQLSVTITEDIVDRAATPNFVHFTDLGFHSDPFAGRNAKPLSSQQFVEDEISE